LRCVSAWRQTFNLRSATDSPRVGTSCGIKLLEVSTENKKQAKAAESTDHRPQHGKQKLIRLDEQNVTGGRKLLFGATDAENTTNNPKEERKLVWQNQQKRQKLKTAKFVIC